MALIRLSACLLLPLLLGMFCLAALLRNKLSGFAFLERLALAFAVGSWLLVLIMFCLPFINIPLAFRCISLTAIIILALLFPLAFKSLKYYLPRSRIEPQGLWFYLLLVLIITKVLFVFWSALIKPVIGPDLLTYYALAAKHVFINHLPLHLFNEPPLPFLLESWIPLSLGAWQDNLLTLFYPLMFSSLLIIFYSALKRYFSALSSLFFTFLLSALPFVLFHAGTLYADFPIAFYYSAATIYLFQFFKEFGRNKEKASGSLIVSIILLAITIWVKKSGVYYAGINFLVLGAFLFINRGEKEHQPTKTFVLAVLGLLVIALPWLLYEKLSIFAGSLKEVIPTIQGSAASSAMDRPVIPMMFKNMLLAGNWQLLWPLFLSVLILGYRRAIAKPYIYLLAIIALQLVSLFILFSFTGQARFILDNSLLNRLMLHFAPVVLYFCAETILTANRSE